MTSSIFIRIGGLAAITGVIAWLVLWSGELLWKNMPFVVEYVVNVAARPLLLLVGVMAAIAALHALQRERYGLPGALASLAPFVGLALVVSSFILHWSNHIIEIEGFIVLVGVGALLMTVGVVALGTITIAVRVLPWWCGAALIVGSPLFLLLGVGPQLEQLG